MTTNDQRTIQVQITLPKYLAEWAKNTKPSRSGYIRELLESEYKTNVCPCCETHHDGPDLCNQCNTIVNIGMVTRGTIENPLTLGRLIKIYGVSLVD